MKLISFILLFSFKIAMAQDNYLSGISLNQSAYTLKLVLDHLKNSNPTLEQQKKALKLIYDMNQISLPNDEIHLTFMSTTETFKSLLNQKFFKLNTEVSKEEIKNLKEKYNKHKNSYTSLGAFIIEGVLNDFSSKKDPYSPPKKQAYMIQKFSGPWVQLALQKSPQAFSSLLTKQALIYLNNLHKQLLIFNLHLTKNTQKTPLFLPLNPLDLFPSNEKTSPSQIDPKQAIENLRIGPTEGANEKIDQLLKKIDQNIEQ